MADELERFASLFRNEEQLRQELYNLLTKMPRIRDVEITHGSQEYGKDIVFYSESGFDEWVLNACVVKNDKISGSADSNAGARNVFQQVEQALDTPYINREGKDEPVARVYVISPWDSPQTTMSSIQGKLKSRSGQVSFLCGAFLREKFSRFWPEFLLFDSTMLGSYVSKLQHQIDEADPTVFLMAEHQLISSSARKFTEIYVRPHFQLMFKQVALRVQMPFLEALKKNVTRPFVEDFANKLNFAAGFLSEPQVWEHGDPVAAAEIAESIRILARGLLPMWDLQYSESLRAVTRKDALNLSFPKNEHDVLEKSTEKCRSAIAAFAARVDRANAFIASNHDIIKKLNSDDYLNYCRVHEVVRRSPDAFGPPPPNAAEPVRQEIMLPSDLLDLTCQSLLITAPPGYGKTSFCKWNILNDIKSLYGKSKMIPIYVPLHQLSTTSVNLDEQVFLKSPELLQLFREAQVTGQTVRLYLDGLDEVTTTEQQGRLMNLAADLAGKYQKIQIVITSRDYVSGAWLRWVPRVNLAGLNKTQVQELISNWFGDDESERDAFETQLMASRTLAPLMSVPLLGTLVLAVYKKKKSIPESRIKLYNVFVDLLCGGWDLAKNIRREGRFGSEIKRRILTAFAGVLQWSGDRETRQEEFRNAVEIVVPALASKWAELLFECLQDGLLVKDGGNIAFAHLSFQEYLAAQDLTDPAEGRHLTVLNKFLLGDDRWREVMSFYVAMTNHPNEVAQWISINHPKAGPGGTTNPADIDERKRFLFKSIAEATPGWRPQLGW